MIFDKLCGMVERRPIRDAFRMLREAALFVFDDTKEREARDMVAELDRFRLPSPVVAVEVEGKSVVVMERLVNNAPSCGLLGSWMVMFAQPSLDPTGPMVVHLGVLRVMDSCDLSPGDLSRLQCDESEKEELRSGDRAVVWGSAPVATLFEDGRSVMHDYEGGDGDGTNFPLALKVAKRLGTWSEEVMTLMAALQDTNRMVVERGPREAPKPAVLKGKRIARAHQRPEFTLIAPHDAYADLHGIARGSGKHVSLHLRRGHLRVYHDARFTEKVRSTPQWIEPVWVGPSEGIVGRRKYRVRLDV